MKNVIKLLQYGSSISLIIMLIMSAVALQSAYAQDTQIEIHPDGTEEIKLSGFVTDRYVLTDSMKESIRLLVEGPAGFRAQCENGKVISLLGYSDPQKVKNVPEAVSDRYNDWLAQKRIQSGARYMTDELGMSQYCFKYHNPMYADSDIRGIGFVLLERNGGSHLWRKLAERVNSTAGILKEIDEEIADLQEKIAEHDSTLADHKERITENTDINSHQDSLLYDMNNRVSALESRNMNVSGHIGINGEFFADQIAPTISAGVSVGQVEFAGWFGYMPNIDTADLDIGVKDLNRLTYGGMATWYAINAGSLSLGPSIGWEHGEDLIKGRNSYVKLYDSVLAGASIDVKIAGPLHFRANVSWAPVIKSNTNKNQVFVDAGHPIRAAAGISINF